MTKVYANKTFGWAWSDRDEQTLREYFRCDSYSLPEIAEVLGRSVEEIKCKLIELDLLPDTNKRDCLEFKRYLTFYIDPYGKMVRVLGRRGYTPDDIIRQLFLKAEGFGWNNDKLYLLEIGDEGVINCQLFRVVPKPPACSYALERV